MQIEKFTKKDGTNGVIFKNAQFACSRNYNGCYFDALETFSVDVPPNSFNNAHNSTLKLEAQFTSTISQEIENKMLHFKADIESFDSYVIENADKVTGFSPELKPINKPAKNAKGERFYANGDLIWESTAFLFGEKAGFVNVDNNFQLEKFSQNEDVLIYEIDKSETNIIETETETETKDTKENFYAYKSVGELVKTSQGIGKVTEITEKENGIKEYTITLKDNSKVIIATNETNNTNELLSVTLSDLYDLIVSKETFNKADDQEDEEQKREAEIIGNINTAKENFSKETAKVGELVNNPKSELIVGSVSSEDAKKSLIKKLY